MSTFAQPFILQLCNLVAQAINLVLQFVAESRQFHHLFFCTRHILCPITLIEDATHICKMDFLFLLQAHNLVVQFPNLNGVLGTLCCFVRSVFDALKQFHDHSSSVPSKPILSFKFLEVIQKVRF